ncbi:hypothetical protein C8J57DRAFT_1721104 [Mycena rebaudengoi]|nr:hypothetical protein C8J57DRAFT_1721104 [Mycena rebaudengoi]
MTPSLISRFSYFIRNYPRPRLFIIGIVVGVSLYVGASIGAMFRLIVPNVDDGVPFTGSTNRQISLDAYFVDADMGAKTVTVDWFPFASKCPSPEMLVNLYVDANLLAPAVTATLPVGSASALVSQLNATQACQPTSRNNLSVFRTIHRLTSQGKHTGNLNFDPGSLQVYPFDEYILRITIFASLASTNESVGIILKKSTGTPLNSVIILNKEQCNNTDQGVYLTFDVSRSAPVLALVTITFTAFTLLGMSGIYTLVAAVAFEGNLANEMLVPIAGVGALFAVMSIRASLPGAPVGFGAFIGTLRHGVRASRCKTTPRDEEMPRNLEETIDELKNAVIEMRRVLAAMETRFPQTEGEGSTPMLVS